MTQREQDQQWVEEFIGAVIIMLMVVLVVAVVSILNNW